MRVLLNAACGLVIAASLWLALMFVVLHRPGFERGLIMSSLFVMQSVLVLAVTNGWVAARPWRVLSWAGAAGFLWTGIRAVAQNLGSNHFEGYVLLIGILLTAHALLTPFTPSSKVHQFGN